MKYNDVKELGAVYSKQLPVNSYLIVWLLNNRQI